MRFEQCIYPRCLCYVYSIKIKSYTNYTCFTKGLQSLINTGFLRNVCINVDSE